MSAVLKTLMCCKRELRMTSPTLMRLALQVLELALELNLDLNAILVSQSDPRLQKADALTKQVISDDLFILTLF
jgi:hypothetical protein